MSDLGELVRATSAGSESLELLKKSPSEILGVSAAAALALDKVGIRTIFDLGTSNLFASARAVLDLRLPDNPANRFGLVASDLLSDAAEFESLDDIPALSIDKLRILSAAQAADLSAALDVQTIRDFALWPPHLAARRLVGDSVGSSIDPEELQTEELRPRMGQYPTERVYYTSLVMLEMLGDPGKPAELKGAITLDAALAAGAALTRPAVGALLTFSQSWYSQGITLGHMLHSLALAPGEATRIAVIDWSRRTRATATETISESEQLDSATDHARAISEVQSAVASDLQQGGSQSSSSSSSTSGSGAMSAGTGFLTSLTMSADVSATVQSAGTNADAQSSSWSLGNRSVLGSMTQNVNDRTEQHSSDVRNRRASAVREVSQSEHEQVSTRIVANYNHMHALTVQYYEVVQIYRTEARLHSADRCLFVPITLLDFSYPNGMKVVERFRSPLIVAALNRRIASLLIDDTTAVSIKPAAPIKFSSMVPRAVLMASALRTSMILQPAATAATVAAPATPAAVAAPSAAAVQIAGLRLWDDDAVAVASRILNRPLIRPDADGLHVPDDTELLSISFDSLNIKSLRIDHVGAAASETFTVPTDSGRVDLPRGIPMIEIDSLNVSKADAPADSGSMTLYCSYQGRRFTLPTIPLDLAQGKALQRVASFTNDQTDRRKELLQHLQGQREYYSRAIFRALDSATLTLILSQYKWNGVPLIDMVEPRPVRVAGNYLILRAPIDGTEQSGLNIGDKPASWQTYLANRGLKLGQPGDQRLIPIPTGGVFAEAVLGRSNAAEKLDITRFWHWQDSPIPLSPPEIAPVSTGSRATAEDLKPGQLSSPVLNIVNPTQLPAPDSMSTVMNALSNMNFRDMSGLAGTQGLVKAGMEGTLQAATEAGQLASTNMQTEAQKAVAMGQIAADLAKSAISAYTGVPMGGGGSVQGISGEGARINHGRSMDERGVPGPGGLPVGGGSGGGTSPNFGGSGSGGAAGSGGFTQGSGGSESGGLLPGGGAGFSHEGMQADQSAIGYSPDGVNATLQPYGAQGGATITQASFTDGDVQKAQKYAGNWADLISFKVPQTIVTDLQARSMQVQDYESAIGDLNLDWYAIKIAKMPTVGGNVLDPAGLLRYVRANLNSFVDTFYSEFTPYDTNDSTKWLSSNPTGAVMKIDIAGPDNAAVVVSLSDANHWIFSTVETPDTGRHPVSGHREFGVRQGQDGAWYIYTKGADRTSDTPETMFDFVSYSAADRLWLSFQNKIESFVNAQGGAATVVPRFSDRFKWKVVKILLTPPGTTM